METKTKYTATEAVTAIEGMTKKRLYEVMNNGGLSYETEEWGNKTRRVIDASELVRVFGDKFLKKGTTDTFHNAEKKPIETSETTSENMLLKQKIESLTERIADKERENAKLWETLEKESEERRKLTMVIADMRSKPPEVVVEKRKGFFATLLRKKD